MIWKGLKSQAINEGRGQYILKFKPQLPDYIVLFLKIIKLQLRANIDNLLGMIRILTICLTIYLAIARDDPKFDILVGKKRKEILSPRSQQLWFTQILDHYDYRNATFWNQRYWIYNDYFNPKIGPVFLYICGEWVCDGVPQTRTWILTYAQRLKGMVIALQHRFYGESLPFGKDSFSIQNMVFLNSEQALRDLAYFIEATTNSNFLGITNNPWISVGGSYPGALSAWLREKYPHLVLASIASSAVIEVNAEIKQFDEQVYISSQKSGNFCSSAISQSSARVQAILNQGERQAFAFKQQFKDGEKLKNKQFLFFWADAIALTVQYGGRKELCGNLKDKSSDQQFGYLVQNAKMFEVYEYSSYYLRNQTFAVQTQSMARPFYYQECTQYALFQTFSAQHPMRSKLLDLDFYSQFCSDAFGKGTWPKVQWKNTRYGGVNLKSSNIFFANGIEDPWRWASLQESRSQGLVARLIDCQECGHCVDMNTPTPQDPENLKKVRAEQYLYLQQWIDEYWRDLRGQSEGVFIDYK